MLFLPEEDPRRQVWEACESPIEQYICVALFELLGCKAVSGPFDRSRLPQLAELAGDSPACFLFSQHSIGVYRADFLVVVVDPKRRRSRLLVVECDGKRYHGSDEQKARDQKRDQKIQEFGYSVVRYTGSAIHGEMRETIDDIRAWIEARGVVCGSPDDREGAAWILLFTPDRTIRKEREAARKAYWAEAAAEERILAGIVPDDL